jgi:hypothetical protein
MALVIGAAGKFSVPLLTKGQEGFDGAGKKKSSGIKHPQTPLSFPQPIPSLLCHELPSCPVL